MFASVRDIAKKSDHELRRLRSLQVNGLTVGVESGCDEALTFANKGYTARDAVEQLRRLDSAGIEYSITYVTGLLGAGRGQWHAYETAETFNKLNPKIIVVSSLTAFPGTLLHEKIQKGTFEEASEAERLAELKTFTEGLRLRVHMEASTKSNAVPLMGILPHDKPLLLARLEDAVERETASPRLRAYRENLNTMEWMFEETDEPLSSRSVRAAEAAKEAFEYDNTFLPNRFFFER